MTLMMQSIPHTDTMPAKFTHRFSGISVWVEPDPSQTALLLKEMNHLLQMCGGHEAGMHEIIPHCTLLYNTSFPIGKEVSMCDEASTHDVNSSTDEKAMSMQQQEGESLLRECLLQYQHRYINTNRQQRIKLMPTSHYYFHYPTTADNGRGFGCAISLLILETSPELKLLQEVVKSVFPPDERHGSSATTKNESRQQQKGDGEQVHEEVEFQPHMALIYAPEDHDSVCNGWLEEHTNQMERQKEYMHWAPAAPLSNASSAACYDDCRHESNDANATDTMKGRNDKVAAAAWDAKYLSIWSTEGTLDEWYPIAKIGLSPPL